MKILFFGDLVGKAGRQAVKKVLPELKKKFQPDFIIANAENLAHGKGVTEQTLQEMLDVGIDAFTSGNHIHKKDVEILENKKFNLVRPANYPVGVPGYEYLKIKKHDKNILIINLMGRVFLQENFDCPFKKFDELYKLLKVKKNDIVIVDFHAETTSEKNAFAWYVDGRASMVLGTHTHVQTADERIFPKGTGFITDVGMVGPIDSVIGVAKEGIIETFLTQISNQHEMVESGGMFVSAVLVDINNKTGKCNSIQRTLKKINI